MAQVYRFGCRAPTQGLELVREQLHAAHDYANDLTAIERGRRHALRALFETTEVEEAMARVKAASPSKRRQAKSDLCALRSRILEASKEEVERINTLEHEIWLQARALTRCYWGTYLDVEAAHRQSRAMPLYERDSVTPADPRFVSWRGDGLMHGHICVQIQGGVPTAEALACKNTRVRLALRTAGERTDNARRARRRYGDLWLRIGSDGRDPVWAVVPILYDRPVPHTAKWKWVRVSVSTRALTEYWTCEITAADSATPARQLDKELRGTLFIDWSWDKLDDDAIRVATWCDDRGGSGEVVLPGSIARGLRKPDGIRAVRDVQANHVRPRFARLLRECADTLPPWLARARDTVHLWKSLFRLHELGIRWRREKFDGAREAYDLLDEWEERDVHLYDYEANARAEALNERLDFYRCVAKKWSQQYKEVVVSNQKLSLEARFGDASDVRFTACVYSFRNAVRNAFRGDAWDGRWKDGPRREEDERSWCERMRDAWMAGGARKDAMLVPRKVPTTNAWADRKRKAAEKRAAKEAARNAAANGA